MAKTKSRTLADFPAHSSARAKLDNLSQQQSVAERELSEANELNSRLSGTTHDNRRIADEAESLLTGVAVAVLPDIKTLRHRCQVLHQAVSLQQGVVNEQRRIAARAIAAEMVDEHQQIVASVAQAGKAFVEAHAQIAEFRKRFGAAAEGEFEGPLMTLDLNDFFMVRFRNDIALFVKNVAEYSGR
jgi:hypothetical protein